MNQTLNRWEILLTEISLQDVLRYAAAQSILETERQAAAETTHDTIPCVDTPTMRCPI